MKKAKMILTAMTVLAVVGAGLAFKAKSYTTPNVFFSDPNSGHCTVPVDFRTTDPADPSAFQIIGNYTTVSTQATCPLTTLTVVNDQ